MSCEVSVVIVSWNACDLTLKCLDSLRDHEFIQVIVSDNGSIDETIPLIKKEHPSVKLIENGKNLGFAAAVNKGGEFAEGKCILLLNNDARVDKDTLKLMLQDINSDESNAVLGPQLIYEDGREQNSVAAIPSLATELLNKSLLKRLFPKRYPGLKNKVAERSEVASVIGACMLIKRDVFEKLMGLDESYFFYLEETDFCLRAKKMGMKVVFAPEHKVVHLQGASVSRVRVKAKVEYQRSLQIFFRKHYGKSIEMTMRLGLLLEHIFKLFTTSLALLLTLGSHQKLREKWMTYSTLIYWQLTGCPRHLGLKPHD